MACIAIIDDNPGTQEIIRLSTDPEHRLISYPRGTLAVDFVRDRKPDVAIVSLELSDVESLDLIRALALIPNGPPVVGISGTLEPAKIVATIRAGAADATARPIRAGELRRCITSAIDSRGSDATVPRDENPIPELVGHSTQLSQLRSQIASFAVSDAPVLVTGESGVGKELVAGALHRLSARSTGPFVPRSCGAIPDTLLETELFGTESGAYTGAVRRAGAFELASGGTLFLDEIGELSPLAQVKLLRALETRRFNRVGGVREIETDIRILAATNRDIAKQVRDGTFRHDLYYRVNVLRLRVPALRERREDIPLLVRHFATRLSGLERMKMERNFGTDALARLSAHDWPGNIRELRNVVHRAILTANNGSIAASDIVFG